MINQRYSTQKTGGKRKMDGQLKVAGVQVTVNQNDIFGNMKNVEKMAMKVAENEKDVDLIP